MEVAVLASPSLIIRTVSVDVKQLIKLNRFGSPSLIIRTVSVDVKQLIKLESS